MARQPSLRRVAGGGSGAPDGDEVLLRRIARGDERAFEELYDEVAGAVLGMVRRVVRDPAQSEEVTQEVMVEVWRRASRYDPERGSVRTWVLTMAHGRAVDRVRSAQAASGREQKVGRREHHAPYDEVVEAAEDRLDRQQVRRCLESLTDLQRESVRLAYWGGYTQREVAELLGAPVGTVKTRLRDGLIRLRDCLGASA